MLNIGVVCPDVEADGVHIPFAKAQLRKLANDWRGYYLSRIIKIDGTTILMEMWTQDAGRVTLTSSLPYMESGFLDHRAVVAGEELMYWPALVEFSPRIASLSNTKGLPNAKGHTLKDGDETWTEAGCTPEAKLKDIAVPIGTKGNTLSFTRAEPAFCDPVKIYQRKLLMELLPPSVFTGKMQLFVQALYGSDRDDFRLSYAGSTPRLKLSTHTFTEPTDGSEPVEIFVELLPGYPSTGLFTTDSGRYLLVEMGIGEVTYREMLPKRLVPRSKRGKEAEAYLLAGLVPSAKVLKATSTKMPIASAGTPLAYGWHFNKAGSLASVVLIAAAPVTGIAAFSEIPLTVNGRIGTQYTAMLSYDSEKKELSCAVTTGATGQFVPYVQGKIFTPSPSGQAMTLMELADGAAGFAVRADGFAPVYCFYMADDSLEVIFTRNGTFTTEPARNDQAGVDGASGEQMFGSPFVTLPCSRVLKTVPISWVTNPSGFGGNNFSYYGGAFNSVGASTTRTTYLTQSDPIPYYRGGPAVLYTEYRVSQPNSYSVVIAGADSQISFTAVLVIPFGSASAVISGKQEVTTLKAETQTGGTFSNNSLYRTDDPDRAPYPPGAPIPWAYAGVLLFTDPIRDLKWPVPGGNEFKCEMKLFTAHGATTLVQTGGSSAPGGLNPHLGRVYLGLFEVAVSAPFYPYPMTVRTAYFGSEVRHDWCMPQEAPWGGIQTTFANGWPENADTPIGWA